MMLRLIRPLIRNNLTRTLMLASQKMQAQSKSGNGKAFRLPPKLAKLQKLFQEDNQIPVHLKGGNNDKILYYSTMGLTSLGLLLNFVLYIGYIID